MHLAFLTPLAALAALLVVLPLLSVAAARFRDGRARGSLGLPRPPVAVQLVVPLAIVLTLVLAGIAAAQPVIEHGVPRRARTDAQVYVLFDISRSMGAAPGPHAASRLARAKRFAVELRRQLPSIPVGVASFTDRVLPLEFPTSDPSSFESVVQQAVGIDQPAPQRFYSDRATTFDALGQFAEQDYFDPEVKHRAVVVLTDGESRPVSPSLADTLRRQPGVHVVFVHVSQPADKLWTAGLPDPNYHTDPSSGELLRRLADSLHGRAVAANDVAGAADALRASLGSGPVRTVTEPARLALMPYVTLAALVPLAFVLWRRNA